MKTKILLLLIGSLVIPTTQALEAKEQAGYLMKQAYLKYGSPEQAREALMPVAKKRLGLCKMCHGPDGSSVKARIPSIAGERPRYLVKRWIEIKGLEHGESKTAQRIAQRINEEEMVALALYYSEIERRPVTYDRALAEKGKGNYKEICTECHKATGSGKPGVPMIARQQPDYIYRSLLQFRDNENWRHGSKMKEVSQDVEPIDAKAVAHYAASLSGAR
jgi:cytochrome c553